MTAAESGDRQPRLLLMTPCHGGQVTTLFANSVSRPRIACRARRIAFGWRLHGSDALRLFRYSPRVSITFRYNVAGSRQAPVLICPAMER
jgi:hypothetical protein